MPVSAAALPFCSFPIASTIPRDDPCRKLSDRYPFQYSNLHPPLLSSSEGVFRLQRDACYAQGTKRSREAVATAFAGLTEQHLLCFKCLILGANLED